MDKKLDFKIYGLRDIQEYKEDRPHILISIFSPRRYSAELPKNEKRLATKFFEFHDLDHLPKPDKICLGCSKPYVLFTDEMAHSIWNFVDEHKDNVEAILCNCEAGISRSAAVIAGIQKGLGYDDSETFKRYLPNRLVYRKIVEARL